jgi:hypothetical protein
MRVIAYGSRHVAVEDDHDIGSVRDLVFDNKAHARPSVDVANRSAPHHADHKLILPARK